MDHLARLILLLCVFVSAPLYAQTCPDGGTCVPVKWHSGTPSDYADSPEAQFVRWLDWAQSAQYQSYTVYQSRGACQVYSASAICPYLATKGLSTYDGSVGMYATCPVGQMVIAAGAVGERLCSVPSCPAGQVRNATTGLCAPASQCPPAGDVVAPAGTVYEAGNGLTNVVCLAGCEASALMAAKHEGRNWVWGPIVSTGAQCQSAPPVSEASPKCSVGQCPGTFNGSQICVPCNETKQDKSTSSAESSASAASGAASGPASTSTKNGSSSTTCKGESCTTTSRETVVNPDGSTDTKDVTTTQSKSDYCKENPKAGACTGSESTWGGTCQAFACDGDAVQCAQARGAWELACQLKTESTDPTVQAGTDAIARTGEASIKDQLGMNTSQVFDLASRLDSTSLFGTPGACPSDTTLSLGIGSVTLPFAAMCPQLNLIGVAMMGLAYLIAAFIVFRPAKGA